MRAGGVDCWPASSTRRARSRAGSPTHRHALGDIVEHGTWLDRDDVERCSICRFPASTSSSACVEIVRIGIVAVRTTWSIIDTAPTGHTLRLLAAPETVASVADVLDALQAEHRLIREQFARVGRPEAADRLIALIADDARETGERLRDRDRTAFEWVMLPEALSLAESADGVAALDRAGIRVREVIVNRVIPDGRACPICDRRRASERRIVAAHSAYARARAAPALRPGAAPRAARRDSARRRWTTVDRQQHGRPRNADAAQRCCGRQAALAGREVGSPDRGSGRREHLSISRDRPVVVPEAIDALRGASLLFFGGKGGVGKTTVAAATAVRLARAEPSRRVLLLSTDPAHSLADVFGVVAGDRAAPIAGGPGNLDVRELDAAAALVAGVAIWKRRSPRS